MVTISCPKIHTTDRKHEKRPNHFSDTETENRYMYVKYYTSWCPMLYKYICSYAVLIKVLSSVDHCRL
jgi:hypothetical protein